MRNVQECAEREAGVGFNPNDNLNDSQQEEKTTMLNGSDPRLFLKITKLQDDKSEDYTVVRTGLGSVKATKLNVMFTGDKS